MSFWDRYLAPGDIRRQQNALQSPHDGHGSQALETADKPIKAIARPRIDAATRARRQNGAVLGGLIFTAFSIFFTRRSVRRKIGSVPSTFTPSINPPTLPKGQGGLDAVEALSLASLNVASIGVLAAGLAMKFFDISDVEDIRDEVRAGLGYDVYGGDAEADKELEDWFADIMKSKEGLSGLMREGVTEKLAEFERREKAKAQLQTPAK